MKKTKNILGVVIIIFIMAFLYGCGNTESVRTSLSIQETQWSEQGSSTYDPSVFTPLQKGDVVYDDNFTKLQIEGIRL